MKKIAMLFNLNRHQFEYETEFDSEYTIDSIYNTLSKNYLVEKIEADKDFNWISKLKTYNPNLVFNICEGFHGPARESVYAAILEQLGLNYSGPDSTNMLVCHNKFLAKKLLKDDVLVPFGYVIKNKDEIKFLSNIKFPVIVKLNSEGSSMGMTKDSVVYNFDSLNKEVTRFIDTYNRGVLVEQYIKGQDISMIYVEGLGALGPCIVNCDSEFYDYEMKSDKDDTVDISTLDGNFDELKMIVENIARKLDIKGYAKLDFRISDGKFYLIEVNAQVSFHPEGEFITCAKKDNYSFEQIINFIVKNALQHENKINSVGIVGDINE
ncbi:MAG: ATP-grasp domain-containing protein [Bacilli bacterium]|jgi:D-alanine--D-alanine ligase|nr:ATP-grasp domain-containing protein [Bacilli bacterium]